jgi:hypothetical protein
MSTHTITVEMPVDITIRVKERSGVRLVTCSGDINGAGIIREEMRDGGPHGFTIVFEIEDGKSYLLDGWAPTLDNIVQMVEKHIRFEAACRTEALN